jgi:N-acetylglutamate synthase/N-acetylornithine aminotransferase
MSEKEINQRIDKLTEQIHENHLEAMTSIVEIKTDLKHLADCVKGSNKKPGPWYKSKLAQGIGAILAAMATGLALLFRK